MPTVSVIIPNYNHAAYLKERIDSVLNQTYTDFEVIILDDCSTDQSRDIIETYRQAPRITSIVYNTQNSGSTFKQWNKGAGLCKGQYIWIAESDDMAAPTFLQEMMDLYKVNANVGLAYCQSFRMDEHSRVTGDWLQHTDDFKTSRWNSTFCLPGKEAVEQYLGYINILPNASAILIRKEAYLKAGGADEAFILNGDWHLYIKIALEGYDIAYTPEKKNYFREHSAKVTRAAIIRGTNILEAYRILKLMVRHASIASGVKKDLVAFYQTSYLPNIFNETVSTHTLVRCLMTAFEISFKSTLKAVITRLPAKLRKQLYQRNH